MEGGLQPKKDEVIFKMSGKLNENGSEAGKRKASLEIRFGSGSAPNQTVEQSEDLPGMLASNQRLWEGQDEGRA